MTRCRAMLGALAVASLAVGLAGPVGAQVRNFTINDDQTSYHSETENIAWGFLEQVAFPNFNTYDGQALAGATVWQGPFPFVGLYARGNGPWEQNGGDTSVCQLKGDNKARVPLTGSVAVDPGAGGVCSGDEVLSAVLTLGAATRSFSAGQGSCGQEDWDSIEFTLAAADGAVDSAAANGQGGCTYVIGSAGAPDLITANGGALEFGDDVDVDVVGDTWDAPSAIGIASFEQTGNVGAPMAVGAPTNYTCVKAAGPCEAGDSTYNQEAGAEGNKGDGVENSIWVVDTDAAGDIVQALVWPTNEYFALGNDQWVNGLMRFTAACDDCPSAPTAVDDQASTIEGGVVNVDILANDRNLVGDPAVDPVTVVLTNNGGGACTIVGANPGLVTGITLDVLGGAPGQIDCAYEVNTSFNDQPFTTNVAAVTVTVEADVDPVAPDFGLDVDTQGKNPGDVVTQDLNDVMGFDPGNEPTLCNIEMAGTNGIAVVLGGNIVQYTPFADFIDGGAQDTFTYNCQDAQGDTSAADGTVTVTITDVDPAINYADVELDVNGEDVAGPAAVTPGNGTPADHTLAVTADADPEIATCAVDPATFLLTVTAVGAGDTQCDVTLTDADGGTSTDTVVITVNAQGNLEVRLPGGSSALSPLSLLLLLGLPLLRRRRQG